MADSVTVKDIAREAEVSVGTVSRVFNNHSNVAEEIRQRVLQAAATLGYTRPVNSDGVPRSVNRALKEIGFLFCSSIDFTAATSNPFWSHILDGVENTARKASIKVTYRAISELAHSRQELLHSIEEMKLGGILLVGPSERDTIEHIKSLRIPMVLVDNYMPGLSIDAVLCNNYEGSKTAVDYLLSEGHRRIAFIGGPTYDGPRPINKIYTIERRAAGYRSALLDAGITVDYMLFESSDLHLESAYIACKRLLRRTTDFTALCCANDSIAIGALKALKEAGLRVPEDISLIGFDDIDMIEHLTPPLSTVRVNKEALGEVAVKMLQHRFTDPDMASVTTLLEVELIKRSSVAAYKR